MISDKSFLFYSFGTPKIEYAHILSIITSNIILILFGVYSIVYKMTPSKKKIILLYDKKYIVSYWCFNRKC